MAMFPIQRGTSFGSSDIIRTLSNGSTDSYWSVTTPTMLFRSKVILGPKQKKDDDYVDSRYFYENDNNNDNVPEMTCYTDDSSSSDNGSTTSSTNCTNQHLTTSSDNLGNHRSFFDMIDDRYGTNNFASSCVDDNIDTTSTETLSPEDDRYMNQDVDSINTGFYYNNESLDTLSVSPPSPTSSSILTTSTAKRILAMKTKRLMETNKLKLE
jgi:hypothetical protein